MRLNLHFHVVALDGVYVRGADGRLSFRRVIPHTEDIERLVLEVAERCEAWLERQGFGADAEVDPEEDDSFTAHENKPPSAHQNQSNLNPSAVGAGAPPR